MDVNVQDFRQLYAEKSAEAERMWHALHNIQHLAHVAYAENQNEPALVEIERMAQDALEGK